MIYDIYIYIYNHIRLKSIFSLLHIHKKYIKLNIQVFSFKMFDDMLLYEKLFKILKRFFFKYTTHKTQKIYKKYETKNIVIVIFIT